MICRVFQCNLARCGKICSGFQCNCAKCGKICGELQCNWARCGKICSGLKINGQFAVKFVAEFCIILRGAVRYLGDSFMWESLGKLCGGFQCNNARFYCNRSRSGKLCSGFYLNCVISVKKCWDLQFKLANFGVICIGLSISWKVWVSYVASSSVNAQGTVIYVADLV